MEIGISAVSPFCPLRYSVNDHKRIDYLHKVIIKSTAGAAVLKPIKKRVQNMTFYLLILP